jgi:catechol 2,3-dioxygenase-like lactoylglutathione lyase family enzyme
MSFANFIHRIESGRTDLILDMLGDPESASILQTHGENLLRCSAYFGDTTAFRALLRAGLSSAVLGADLGLNRAAFHGHWQLCEFLLENGASAGSVDPETGETPLHSALTNEDRLRYDLVLQVLLRAGADPNAATKPGVATGSFMRDARTRGETPLHRAALFGTPATVHLLLEAGASREARDTSGDTPLGWASWARRPVEVLRLLLYGEHRIHPNYKPMRANLLGTPDGAETKDTVLRAVHPVLPALDVEESVRFFQKLGFSLLFLASERPQYAAMGRDGVEIHLQWADESQWAHSVDRPAFRFVTSDVDALFEEIVMAGGIDMKNPGESPWATPANTPWGTREFHVRDPAGSSLQFYQEA